MKFKCVIEYEYPVEHKPPVKAEIVLHGDRVTTDKIAPYKDRPHGEWIFKVVFPSGYWECSICKKGRLIVRENFCPNCGADMQANDRQVTGKLNSEIEYKAKVKELEDAIAKCEKAEKEFASRTCKFRSPTNCDFCSFHSDCNEHWKEGEKE